jgi:16S rRNA (cytosine1402-N4)-methyltransferase
MEPGHVPVMPREIIGFLALAGPGTVIDGTAGGGGHTDLLSLAFPQRRILAFERDPAAAASLVERFSSRTNVDIVNSSYTAIPDEVSRGSLPPVSAALFDFGLSSIQLDSPERGFSHRIQGPLDMRFDQTSGLPAWKMLERMPEKTIADVIYRYGEEGRSRAIARKITEAMPVKTTEDLAAAVKAAVRGNPVKPLSRVFQAFRIMVNDELGHLERLLQEMHLWTAPGCRIAMITFHSLEDRLVKLHLRDGDHFSPYDPPWMVPERAEIRQNPRARSARLRLGVRR